MADYVKHTEGKKSLYLIPVVESDDGIIYLDFTRPANGALRDDRKDKFDQEKGPGFGFAVMRAVEYADFLRTDCNITPRNFQRFNTRNGYNLFLAGWDELNT